MFEVSLWLGYPRRVPLCRLLTPIFHPNIDDSMVCTGDFWTAWEGLADLIIRIGRMIAYQEYNSKSPPNGLAAKGATQNAHRLPVGARCHCSSVGAGERTAATVPAAPVVATTPPPPQIRNPGPDPWSEEIVIE